MGRLHPKNTITLIACAFAMTSAHAWNPGKIDERHAKAEEAKSVMLEKDPDMQRCFDSAVGWVIIPTVGKGGIGIGRARGEGLRYENGEVSADVTLTQLTAGFQWGGQKFKVEMLEE